MSSNFHVVHVLDSLAPDGTQNSYLSMLPNFIEAGLRVGIVALSVREDSLASAFRDAGATVWEWDQTNVVRHAVDLHEHLVRHPTHILHSALARADLACRLAVTGTGATLLSTLANISYGPIQRENFQGNPIKLRLVHALDASTARLTHHYHAVAEHVADVMAPRLLVPRERVTVVPRGRDQMGLGRRTPERRKQVRARMGVDEARPIVLAIGRHEVQKAPLVNLEAFARTAEQHPTAELWMAGHEGRITEKIRARVAQSDLTSRVRILGARSDVPDLMAAADVLSFPSRWEGMPGTLIEAMALELPVVASDIPSVREVMTSACGTLLEVDAAPRFADAVSKILTHPETAAASVARARQRFEDRYTVEAASSGMLDLYRTLAAP